MKHYCAGHPGHSWSWQNGDGNTVSSGTCPTIEEQATIAANQFISKHKDYVPEEANSQAMVDYISHNNLDPREERSYEKGYESLKKQGKLHLYAK